MPNEPVQCPNCGSGDVQQIAADSYVCDYCQTKFRWADPTRRTIVHTLVLCECGRVATLICCRCKQKGICDGKCDSSAIDMAMSDSRTPCSLDDELDELYRRFQPEVQSQVKDLVRRTAQSYGVPSYTAYLCDECTSGFWKALNPTLDSLKREQVE